jgi:hypothetical protein
MNNNGKGIATIITFVVITIFLVLNSVTLVAILSGYKNIHTITTLLIVNVILFYSMFSVLLKSFKKEK